jgi:hypothetical protein
MPNDLPSTLYVPARFDWLQHQPVFSGRALGLKPDESAKYQ